MGQVANAGHAKLSSSTYDRRPKREVDVTADQYLQNSKINPEPYADFLYRLSQEGHDLSDAFQWISTHPESEERAKEILNEAKIKKIKTKILMDSTEWATLKGKLMEMNGE